MKLNPFKRSASPTLADSSDVQDVSGETVSIAKYDESVLQQGRFWMKTVTCSHRPDPRISPAPVCLGLRPRSISSLRVELRDAWACSNDLVLGETLRTVRLLLLLR